MEASASRPPWLTEWLMNWALASSRSPSARCSSSSSSSRRWWAQPACPLRCAAPSSSTSTGWWGLSLDAPAKATGGELPPGAAELLERRAAARAARDFATSDALRDELAALGVEVRDTPEGQVPATVRL